MSGRLGGRKVGLRAGRRTTARSKRVKQPKKKAAASRAKPRSPEALLEKVEAYLDSFRYEEVVELCLQAVEREPDSVTILEEVGPLLLELGHVDHAHKLLKRAAELCPDKGYMKYLYLGQLADGVESAEYLSHAISIMTRGREGSEGAGGGCVRSEGEEGAGGRCESSEGVMLAQGGEERVSDEDISRAYCSLAEVYLTDACFTSGAEEKCHSSCREAVRFAPTNYEAHQLLASCLLSMSRVEEAKEAIHESLSLWLPRKTGEEGSGMCEGVRGDGVKELPPYFSRVNCAKILMELQLYDEAQVVLERLLRDDDEVVLVWYLMGWLHLLTDDRDSAHFYLEQATELAGRVECDDKQMLDHITELMAELDQQKEEDEDKEEILKQKDSHDMDTS